MKEIVNYCYNLATVAIADSLHKQNSNSHLLAGSIDQITHCSFVKYEVFFVSHKSIFFLKTFFQVNLLSSASRRSSTAGSNQARCPTLRYKEVKVSKFVCDNI